MSRDRTLLLIHRQTASMLLITILLLGLVQGPAVVRCDFASYNQVALKLLQALWNPTKNLVVAPTVVEMLLVMLEPGARGRTATEIYKILRPILGGQGQISDDYKNFIESLEATDPDTWRQSTKMIVEESFPIKPDFQSFMENDLAKNVWARDIKENPEYIRDVINTWYRLHTEHFFPDMLHEGSLSENTHVILTSAARFKAKWTDRAMEPTVVPKEISFYVTPEKTSYVKTMVKLSSRFRYKDSKSLQAQLLEIPFDNEEFKMLIILPYSIFGLADVQSKLLSSDLGEELAHLTETSIDVLIPQFKIETNITLDKALKKMGMNTTFSDKADFSGISDIPTAVTMIQNAIIEVTAEGARAAAGYSVLTEFRYNHKYPRTVLCDHPFLFMVVKHNTIVLIGRLADP